MKVVRITFQRDCQIHELPKYLFEEDLYDLADSYIWNRRYLDDNKNYIMLSTDKNIIEFFDTETGDKTFIAFIPADRINKIQFNFNIKEKYNYAV